MDGVQEIDRAATRGSPVILALMKTAISVPDETLARVEAAAASLGLSRSEFFSRAAERWILELADAGTTAAIDAALDESADDPDPDAAFVTGAARRTLADDRW